MSCSASTNASDPFTRRSWPTSSTASRNTSRVRGRNLRRLRRPNSNTAAQSSAANKPPPQRIWLASPARPAARNALKLHTCGLVTCSPAPLTFAPPRADAARGVPCQARGAAVHHGFECGAAQGKLVSVPDRRLHRLPELVALREQEARRLGVQLVLGHQARGLGRVQLLPLRQRL